MNDTLCEMQILWNKHWFYLFIYLVGGINFYPIFDRGQKAIDHGHLQSPSATATILGFTTGSFCCGLTMRFIWKQVIFLADQSARSSKF